MRINQENRIPAGSDLYYSLLYTSGQRRIAAEALHAFAREVRRIPTECSDPGVARMKLQWWREELARAAAGQPRHPVGTALNDVYTEFEISPRHFEPLIDGVESELQMVTPPSQDLIDDYCRAVGGTLWRAWAQINGGDDGACADNAARLAGYVERANILRTLREDLDSGLCKLNAEQLAFHGISHQQLTDYQATSAIRTLFAAEVTAIRNGLAASRSAFTAVHRQQQLGMLIVAAITDATLTAYEEGGLAFLNSRVDLTPLRKLWIAWRTRRRERP